MTEYKNSAHDKATAMTRGLSIYRGLLGNHMHHSTASALAEDSPKLKAALTTDLKTNDKKFSNLSKHLDQVFRDHPMMKPKYKRPNLLRQAKNTLPCGKRTLSHLIGPNGE